MPVTFPQADHNHACQPPDKDIYQGGRLARQWVVYDLLPYLRRHGPTSAVDIATHFGITSSAVGVRCAYAENTVTTYKSDKPNCRDIMIRIHHHLA